MGKDSILEFNNKESFSDVLNELLRDGAQQLIRQAVETELSEYMSQHQRITDDGRLALVRNGYLPEREILTGIGPVSVRIPKVRSKTGQALTFRSALVPPYVRKTRSLEAALPWLYLKGVSTGEMGEALKVLVGNDAEEFAVEGAAVGHGKRRIAGLLHDVDDLANRLLRRQRHNIRLEAGLEALDAINLGGLTFDRLADWQDA